MELPGSGIGWLVYFNLIVFGFFKSLNHFFIFFCLFDVEEAVDTASTLFVCELTYYIKEKFSVIEFLRIFWYRFVKKEYFSPSCNDLYSKITVKIRNTFFKNQARNLQEF